MHVSTVYGQPVICLNFRCSVHTILSHSIRVYTKSMQAYHRDLLEQRAHMTVLRSHPPPALVRDKSVRDSSTSKSPVRRPPKHGKGERKSNSRRHRRAGSGNRGSSTTIWFSFPPSLPTFCSPSLFGLQKEKKLFFQRICSSLFSKRLGQFWYRYLLVQWEKKEISSAFVWGCEYQFNCRYH